jgi:hypothetical protein
MFPIKSLTTLLLITSLFACSKQNTTTEPDAFEANRDLAGDDTYAADQLARMQGTWIHTEDSLSVVEVTDAEWIFKYAGTGNEAPDSYTITIADSLPKVVGTGVRGDYFILANKQDTLHYEIEGISPEYMSVIYLARGNSHTYRKSN